MAYFIKGQHSIIHACLNSQRQKKIFYGERKIYEKLKLECDFVVSNKNQLMVNELMILTPLDDVLQKKRILLIDEIFDTINLGNLLRTAAVLDFGVLLRDRGCPINETVIDKASGGVEYIKLAILKNFSENLKKFQDRGFWLVGLDEKGENNHNFNNKKIILAIGSEGKGLSSLVKNKCDFLLSLNHNSKFTTLNAANAAAISMDRLKI